MKGNFKCEHYKKDIPKTLFDIISEIENYKIDNKKFSDLFGEIYITSGARCPDCNSKAGGSNISTHLIGLAFDIACDKSNMRYFILEAIFKIKNKYNISRLGIHKNFIHIDIATTKNNYPVNVIWLY